jgi:hypothetical protein
MLTTAAMKNQTGIRNAKTRTDINGLNAARRMAVRQSHARNRGR